MSEEINLSLFVVLLGAFVLRLRGLFVGCFCGFLSLYEF